MMGRFEDQVNQCALRERATDSVFYRDAVAAHRAIGQLFDDIQRDGSFQEHFQEPSRGYFGIDLRNWPRLAKHFRGQLHFKGSSVFIARSGLGRDRNRVVVIRIEDVRRSAAKMHLEFPNTFNTDWHRNYRKLFLHEFVHYLDSKRNPLILGKQLSQGSSSQFDAGDIQGYYNNPTELQGYYIEALVPFYDMLEDLQGGYAAWPLGKRIAMAQATYGKDFRNFLRLFESNASREWWTNLTRDNKRRVFKRLATTYAELVSAVGKLTAQDWQSWTSERMIASLQAARQE